MKLRLSLVLCTLSLVTLIFGAPSAVQALEIASADLQVQAAKPVFVCAQHRTHAKQAFAARPIAKAKARSY
jgi:hypothetical protein